MEASEAAWAGVGWGWSMAVFTYQLVVCEEVLWGGRSAELGLIFQVGDVKVEVLEVCSKVTSRTP
jgi:hypothetical protein